jgi:hypothetical protein
MTADQPGNHKTDHNEEPTPTQEESVPSDGTDVEGEAMMKSVRNKQLNEPPPTPPRDK